MKETSYKKFSLKFHEKNWQRGFLNFCQFELTFACSFHCLHCYTDCYNRPSYLKRELKTPQILYLLDKLKKSGVFWLCFTGGDPLIRNDFLKIYNYAKKLGFLITIFTNGYLINKRILEVFKNSPPFNIELTLNAVKEDLFEKITQRKGSFKIVIKNIELLLKNKIPLKIKTQVTRINYDHLPKIKNFLKERNLNFYPDFILYPRLNKDTSPCNLRIKPEKIVNFFSKNGSCKRKLFIEKDKLFPCTISSGDGLYLDPYGNTFPCQFIRSPRFNLFKFSVFTALKKIKNWIEEKQKLPSICKDCNLRNICLICPGKSILEENKLNQPPIYYCRLAKLEYESKKKA